MAPKELARFLGISTSTLARRMKESPLPHFRIGGGIRFMPREVIDDLKKKPK